MDRIYYVPVGLDISAITKGQFVVLGDDWGTIDVNLGALGARAAGCIYLGDDLDDSIPRRHQRALFRLHAHTLRSAVKAQSCLQLPNVIVTFDRSPSHIADIKALSSLRIKLDVLQELPHLSPHEVDQLLDYFLHDRASMVPLEPFARILFTLLKKTQTSLWELHRRNIDRFIFVDDDRNVAGSLEDLKLGKTMGRLEDGLEVWRASETQKELDAFFASLVTSHPACIECSQFASCRGWGVFGKEQCELWLSILDRLSAAAEEIDALRSAMNSDRERLIRSDKTRKDRRRTQRVERGRR